MRSVPYVSRYSESTALIMFFMGQCSLCLLCMNSDIAVIVFYLCIAMFVNFPKARDNFYFFSPRAVGRSSNFS